MLKAFFWFQVLSYQTLHYFPAMLVAGQSYAYVPYDCKFFDFRLSDLSKGQQDPLYSELHHVLFLISQTERPLRGKLTLLSNKHSRDKYDKNTLYPTLLNIKHQRENISKGNYRGGKSSEGFLMLYGKLQTKLVRLGKQFSNFSIVYFNKHLC